MEPTDFERIFAALAAERVRFVVVGGVAVVLQGYARLTADLDLVVSLDPANARRAMQALSTLGYRPRAPVDAMDFAEPARRRGWIEEKGLAVFSLWSPHLPATEVDVFVEEPIPFEDLWSRASQVPIGDAQVAVAAIADLVALKRLAGRPKDLQDIAELERLDAARREGKP